MQLVLNCGEKIFGDRRIFVVVSREGVYICDLLVKAPFASPYFADALQQFIKLVFAENLVALFEPLII